MRTSLALLIFTILFPYTANATHSQQTAAVLRMGLERAWDSDGPFTMGFRFRVNQPIVVTAFGVFDNNNDGLAVPHLVRLWSAIGTPLHSVTVPAGATAPLMDRFRYVPVPPVLLPPDTEYMIGAANFGRGADHYLATQPVPQASSRITLFDSYEAYTPSGNLVFPSQQSAAYGTPAWFGPNFRFVAVPEPSTRLLITVGCGLAIICQRGQARS